MRRTYSATAKRVMVNLNEKDLELFREVQLRLISHYNLHSKPTLSLLMSVALQRFCDEQVDPDGLKKLREELLAASKTKREAAMTRETIH